MNDISKFAYKAGKLLDQQSIPLENRYVRFQNTNGDIIEMKINMSDYINIYELREIREWWEKLTKPRLFNLPRIRLWNLWHEFLYIMGV